MIDTAEIRAAAKAATGGEWATTRYLNGCYHEGGARDGWMVEGPTHVPDYEHPMLCEADATHTATANPATVLALLDEIESLKRLNDELIFERDVANTTRRMLIKELAQYKELLDTALEQNQIIGELHQHAVMELARCKDELIKQESERMALLPGPWYMDDPDGGSVTVIEQFRRMAQDAARYRAFRAALIATDDDFFERAAYWETADESVITEAAIDDAFDEAMKGTT